MSQIIQWHELHLHPVVWPDDNLMRDRWGTNKPAETEPHWTLLLLVHSSAGTRSSVWGCARGDQDKGHLRWVFTHCGHQQAAFLRLKMSGNHWLVKSSFYPTYNTEAHNGSAVSLFPSYKWNSLWSSSTREHLRWLHTCVKDKTYTSRELHLKAILGWTVGN